LAPDERCQNPTIMWLPIAGAGVVGPPVSVLRAPTALIDADRDRRLTYFAQASAQPAIGVCLFWCPSVSWPVSVMPSGPANPSLPQTELMSPLPVSISTRSPLTL
jgi:hypothetical protein